MECMHSYVFLVCLYLSGANVSVLLLADDFNRKLFVPIQETKRYLKRRREQIYYKTYVYAQKGEDNSVITKLTYTIYL